MPEYSEGDRVRVTIEGTVRNLDSDGCFTLVDRNGSCNAFFPRGDGSRVEALDPEYEVGAVYVDADRDVFVRRADDDYPWRDQHGDTFSESYPARPLRKLVPEPGGADG